MKAVRNLSLEEYRKVLNALKTVKQEIDSALEADDSMLYGMHNNDWCTYDEAAARFDLAVFILESEIVKLKEVFEANH